MSNNKNEKKTAKVTIRKSPEPASIRGAVISLYLCKNDPPAKNKLGSAIVKEQNIAGL